MNKKKTGIAVIGYGGMGAWHCRTIKRIENLELMGIYMDTETYSVSAVTGEPIVNRFQSGDLAYYGGENMKYVSRSDWKGTFPTAKLEIELTESLMAEMTGIKQYEKIVVEGEEIQSQIGRAVQQECRDRSRMPSSA